MRAGARAAAGRRTGAERLQKVLSDLGIASRRDVERWIRAGRLSVNGKTALLGMRVSAADQLKLDGRVIRRQASASAGVLLCHRSPGELLLPLRRAAALATAAGDRAAAAKAALAASARAAQPSAMTADTAGRSLAERLPRRMGRRFISVSPMPVADGGLELLTAEGALAARMQRAVGMLESEFSVRVRGELSVPQLALLRQGMREHGEGIEVRALEPNGGQASNRWYRLIALGASGREVRQLFERHSVAVVRVLRIRIGTLALPRNLLRGHWRELARSELAELIGSRD